MRRHESHTYPHPHVGGVAPRLSSSPLIRRFVLNMDLGLNIAMNMCFSSITLLLTEEFSHKCCHLHGKAFAVHNSTNQHSRLDPTKHHIHSTPQNAAANIHVA